MEQTQTGSWVAIGQSVAIAAVLMAVVVEVNLALEEASEIAVVVTEVAAVVTTTAIAAMVTTVVVTTTTTAVAVTTMAMSYLEWTKLLVPGRDGL